MIEEPTLLERYQACMVLGGVGDCLGYRDGIWEFNYSGPSIHAELQRLGGVKNLSPKGFLVSDDTVMLIATALGVICYERDKKKNKLPPLKEGEDPKTDLYLRIGREYRDCMKDMAGRAPGRSCIMGANAMRPERRDGYIIPANESIGCGAAMRAMCIGLRYPREEDEDDLIAVSIESGRMSHNHPTGYLGALVTALFTAYSVRQIDPNKWGKRLLDIFPRAKAYVRSAGRDVQKNMDAWGFFENAWRNYLLERGLLMGHPPRFPEVYGVAERDAFYTSLSLRGWGGAHGHDASIIAYDAFLGSQGNWEELCLRGMFHGGDNDSTGCIAGCWYGAFYGFRGVPSINYQGLEKEELLRSLGRDLCELAGERL